LHTEYDEMQGSGAGDLPAIRAIKFESTDSSCCHTSLTPQDRAARLDF